MSDNDEIDRRIRYAVWEERQRRSDRRWTRAGVVASCVIALAAVITLVNVLYPSLWP